MSVRGNHRHPTANETSDDFFFNYKNFLRNPNLLKKAEKKKKLEKVIQDQQNEHPPTPSNTWSFTRQKKTLKKHQRQFALSFT